LILTFNHKDDCVYVSGIIRSSES